MLNAGELDGSHAYHHFDLAGTEQGDVPVIRKYYDRYRAD